jgi:dolichol-phosphate mannosyltransferase
MPLTIVIPTYNESDNISKITSKLLNLPIPDLRLLIVDDNSPDGTGDIAEALRIEYQGKISVLHRKGKLGLGSAYIQGFKKAIEDGANTIVQMDADFSHHPDKLLEMEKTIEACDFVVGSRYVPGGDVDSQWPMWRKSLSSFGNFYARTILRLKIRDATGGFKMWRKNTLSNMPLDRIKSNGYAFQVEMNHVATRLGFIGKEIPIYFADREEGSSKMSLMIQVEAAFRVWQILFAYRDLKPIHISKTSNI